MENKISKAKNILLVLTEAPEYTGELKYLMEHFCGSVITHPSEIGVAITEKRIYVCGDIARLGAELSEFFIIEELAFNYENRLGDGVQVIGTGKVPVVIHHAGVYFRKFFEGDGVFHQIESEHEFQHLTESTKPGQALRKGIYLSEIEREGTDAANEKLHFHLLRCSSNLTGPTDNFRTTDWKIIKAINEAAHYVFEHPTSLNHVLAQIYQNKKKGGPNAKESKAKISAHSDKTKDMREDGLIAFCTFYDSSGFEELTPSETDPFDWCYKKHSGLTRLHFKLKPTVDDSELEPEFSVTLYPNSVFFIPLSTNRLYTHAIRPSMLNIDRIPTRMGYVVRSSKAEAVFMNNRTYIREDGEWIALQPMTSETMDDLRHSYYQENRTEDRIKYGKVHFSMNKGDYEKPIY